MKHELGRKIMTELLAAMKTYSYFINDGDENNKSKRHEKVCHKKKKKKNKNNLNSKIIKIV